MFGVFHPSLSSSEIIRAYFDHNMGDVINSMLCQGYMVCLPLRRLSPGFRLRIHNFVSRCEGFTELRRGLCCLPVGDNLITGHAAGRASRLPGPAASLTIAAGPQHPAFLGPSPTGAWGGLHQAIHSMGSKANRTLLGLPCCQTGEARLWKMLV